MLCIPDQVKLIGNLSRLRRAITGCLRIQVTTVPANDLGVGDWC
jgi:hypothetical protein